MWKSVEFEMLECNKEFAAGIFIIDMMVKKHLKESQEFAQKWETEVVQSWFHTDDESAADFLLRANRFLRVHIVNGINIVQSVVKTQSYVAFMRMPKLVSLLLFEYLELRKLEEASAAGAAGGSNLLLHGFCTFVSSSGRIRTLADADAPVRCTQPTVVQGL